MKTIVVYYSKNGSNRYLAGKISESLTCDMEEIRPRLNVFLFFLMGLNFGIKRLKHDMKDYDKVILVGPIWMGKLIPPLESFILKFRNDLKQLIFVSCCGSSDAKKDEKFGHGFVFKEVEALLQDKCALCRAFPIDLVLPEDKKEEGDVVMKTRLSDKNFRGAIQERLDLLLTQVKRIESRD